MLTEEERREEEASMAAAALAGANDLQYLQRQEAWQEREERQRASAGGAYAHWGLHEWAVDGPVEPRPAPPPEPYPQVTARPSTCLSKAHACCARVCLSSASSCSNAPRCRLPCAHRHPTPVLSRGSTLAHFRVPTAQILESDEPDLLLLQYEIVPDDSKPELSDHQFVGVNPTVLQAPTPLEYDDDDDL